MLKFIQDNKGKLSVAALLAGAAGVGYLYLRKEHKKSLISDQFRADLKAKATIKTTAEGFYDVNTLLYVKSSVLQAGIREFAKQLYFNRKDRRNVASTYTEYIKSVDDYMNDIEVITKDLETVILEELSIDASLYKKSQDHYTQTQNSEYLAALVNMSLLTRIEMETQPKFDNARDLHHALANLAEVVKKNEKKLSELRKTLKNHPRSSQILRKKIYDYIFEETGLEEEEIMRSVAQFSSDSDTKALNEKLTNIINIECKGVMA